jgi:hypothetical protein
VSSGTLAAPVFPARARKTGNKPPGRDALERAIVQTVAYADVFDYPLTNDEVHRYLIGVAAGRGTIRTLLADAKLARGILSRGGRYFTLAGRESTIEHRRRRAATSSELWRSALRYGRRIGGLPFVRMVAITGALAMDNVADGDIDFLIVTMPGRLWLCRALVVGVVKLAAMRGVTLCPNYFLSERALELSDRNLFTAHEVAQMVPLAGTSTYAMLRDLNRWTATYLPNADGSPRRLTPTEPGGRRRALAEATLRTPLGGAVERWEMTRKLRKLGTRGAGHDEADFTADWCKGHFDDHGQLTLARYAERLQALEPHLTGVSG